MNLDKMRERIDELVEKRRKNAFQYNSMLSQIQGLSLPMEFAGCVNVYWMYSLLVNKDFGMSREQLMKRQGKLQNTPSIFPVTIRTFSSPSTNFPQVKHL